MLFRAKFLHRTRQFTAGILIAMEVCGTPLHWVQIFQGLDYKG